MSNLTPSPQPTAPDDDRNRLALTTANLREVLSKPLRVLPPEVRPDAARVWLCYRHLSGMESGLPIATLLSVWIDEHGLHPDDAVACLRKLTAPDAVGGHRFASDLTATLGGLATAAIRDRREAEKRRREAEADARARREALPEAPAQLKALVADFGREERSGRVGGTLGG